MEHTIKIKIKLEAEETINKLKTIDTMLKGILSKLERISSIELKQEKDYTTTCYYDRNGKLEKEETVQYRYNEEAEQSTCPKIEIGMHMPG